MANHPKPEEIVAKLQQADVLISQGQSVADALRAIGVSARGACGTNSSSARSSTRSKRRRL